MAAGRTEHRRRFEELVRRAEREIEENPRRYRGRVVMLALLGYAVIVGLLLLLGGLLFGTLWIALTSTALFLILLKKKVIVLIGAAIWFLTKALWVRIDPPEGYPLERDRHPLLWAEVDTLRQRLRTPPIHRIVLTAEFNAAISQVPRVGPLGWERNTLVLGLELLLSLSPEQARAVLAHELGHLSANHGRLGGWIYRIRESWYRLMVAFDRSRGWAQAPLRRFFRWYAPYFDGYSFALARSNEYQAYRRRCPDDRDGDFTVGRLLLERDDPAGIEPLQRAAEKRSLKANAYHWIHHYHLRHDDTEAAERWLQALEAAWDEEESIEAERGTLQKGDTIDEIALSDEVLGHYARELSAHRPIKHAWLAQKVVTNSDEEPLLVVAVQLRGLILNEEKLLEKITAGGEFPLETFFIASRGDAKPLAKQVVRKGHQLF